jgi:hypothetical protein
MKIAEAILYLRPGGTVALMAGARLTANYALMDIALKITKLRTHIHIGLGCIGLSSFYLFMCNRRLKSVRRESYGRMYESMQIQKLERVRFILRGITVFAVLITAYKFKQLTMVY